MLLVWTLVRILEVGEERGVEGWKASFAMNEVKVEVQGRD